MQNQFPSENSEPVSIRHGEGDNNVNNLSVHASKTRSWLFRVKTAELLTGETVCVTGDHKSLGQWAPENAIPLQQEDAEGISSAVVEIPDNKLIQYRFCICVIIEKGIQVIVRSWETNFHPRRVECSAVSPMLTDTPLFYGSYDDTYKVDYGWLTKESMLQLKFHPNSLTMWASKYVPKIIYLKLTAVNIRGRSNNLPDVMTPNLDNPLSDTGDTVECAKFTFTEVVDLYDRAAYFKPQRRFGIPVRGNILIFQSTVISLESTAYLLDFYAYMADDPYSDPDYIGCSYLLPTTLESSEGSTVLPITSLKQEALGKIHLDYLKIVPFPNFKSDMSITYSRHWKKDRCGLDVGHRGSGSSFINKVQNCAEVRENTIASLKSATTHGADFVEFDVQLTKDMVPIIYHDFHVCIAMKAKTKLNEDDMLEIPLKDLTFDQLRQLKIYHLSEGRSKNQRFFDEELEEHQPFPSLEHAFHVLQPHVGFNIEIKWTMKLENGSYELDHPIDLNIFVDKILEVVMRCAGERRIVFSCFNPDICQALRLKQNKYPVMFLTIGNSSVYPRYYDPRCWSIESAIQYATISQLLGINVHTEDLLKDISLIDVAVYNNLIVFCWGDDNANTSTIKYLKELGIHGVIYDKIQEYSCKENKESIFFLKLNNALKTEKESTDLDQLAAVNSENYISSISTPEKVAEEEREQASASS